MFQQLQRTIPNSTNYTNSEFEIIIEGYYGNTTTYTGWLWEDGKRPVTAIMYVWNSGDMVYNVKKINDLKQQFYMIIIWRKRGIEFKDDKIYKYKRYR